MVSSDICHHYLYTLTTRQPGAAVGSRQLAPAEARRGTGWRDGLINAGYYYPRLLPTTDYPHDWLEGLCGIVMMLLSTRHQVHFRDPSFLELQFTR